MFIRAKFVWNVVSRDRAGFDAALSWNVQSEAVETGFALPVHFHALAQVKASDDLEVNRPRMTLARALSLIDYNGPSFVFLINFGGTDEVVSAEVLHVHSEFIGAVLKRVAEEPNDALAERSITLGRGFTRVVSLQELPAYVRNIAGPSTTAYGMEKLATYDKCRREAKVNAAVIRAALPAHAEQEFLDLSLGLREQVEITPIGDISLAARGVQKTLSNTKLVMKRTGGVPVRVELMDQPTPTTFEGLGFSTTTMLPWLADERHETRLAGVAIEARIRPAAKEWEVSFQPMDLQAKYDIGALGSEAAFLLATHLSGERKRSLRVRLQAKDETHEATFHPAQGTLSDRERTLLQQCAAAGDIVRRLAPAPVLSEPFLLRQQAAALSIAATLLTSPAAQNVSAAITIDVEAAGVPPLGSPYAIPLISRCVIGDFVFAVAGFLRGTLVEDVDDEERRLLSLPTAELCISLAEPHLKTVEQREDLDRRVEQALKERAEQLDGFINARPVGAAVY